MTDQFFTSHPQASADVRHVFVLTGLPLPRCLLNDSHIPGQLHFQLGSAIRMRVDCQPDQVVTLYFLDVGQQQRDGILDRRDGLALAIHKSGVSTASGRLASQYCMSVG